MVNCKKCSWCFDDIEDEFVVNEEWDFFHIECYREFDKTLEKNK